MATEHEKGYQGWTNYETWAVALWIGNEPGSYEYWQKEQAEECYREAVTKRPGDTREEWTEAAGIDLGDRMEAEFTSEDACPVLGQASVYADLLNAALGEVNWYEIAENYLEDLDRDEIEAEVKAG